MIELDGTAFLHSSLASFAIDSHVVLALQWSGSARDRRHTGFEGSTASSSRDSILELIYTLFLTLVHSLLLLLACSFQRRKVSALHCWSQSAATWTHHHLGSLAWLRREGPVGSSDALPTLLSAQWPRLRHRLDGSTHGCGDSYGVGVITRSTLDPVPRWQEGVKPLN